MRIFLTGATGFLGSAIVTNLTGEGHHIVGLVRSEQAATTLRAAGAEPLVGDLRDHESLRRGVSQADAIIHTAFDHDFSRMAENCEVDRNAIEAIGSAVVGSNKKLIVTSGLPPIIGRVATEADVLPAGEGGMPRVSEQTALALTELGIRASVVRMPQVHNEQKQGFASYLLSHARESGVSAFVDGGKNRWPAVHRLDAARLYGLVLHRGESGQCYHAVSEEGVPFRQIAEAIAKRLDVPLASLSGEEAARHFGWLDRIAQMDVPASSERTKLSTQWRPIEVATLVDDILQSA